MTIIRRIRSMVCVALALAAAARAQSQTAQPAATEVKVGVFLNNVPQVSLVENSVTLDAYVWFRWDAGRWPPADSNAAEGAKERGAVLAESEGSIPNISGPAESFEVIGSSEQEKIALYNRPASGYCCVQWKGKRSNFWDVRNYPFDRQEIRFVLEDAAYDDRQLRYVIDAANSGYSDELRIPGFQVQSLRSEVIGFTYPTNFGDPALATDNASRYSRATFVLTARRDGWGLFFKLFTALLVSTFVALLAFFINPTQVDPRFGLCVGGLFGIVASGYAVSSLLPESGEVCYADRLHQAALLVVLATVAESAYSLSLHLNRGERGAAIAKRIDRVSFFVLGIGFLTAVAVLTYGAASAA